MSAQRTGLKRIIERRVRMGYMPHTRNELVEWRGSVEKAALDLAEFVPALYDDCLAVLEEIYPEDD